MQQPHLCWQVSMIAIMSPLLLRILASYRKVATRLAEHMTFHSPPHCLKYYGVTLYSKPIMSLLVCSCWLSRDQEVLAARLVRDAWMCFPSFTSATSLLMSSAMMQEQKAGHNPEIHLGMVFKSASSVAFTACVYVPAWGENSSLRDNLRGLLTTPPGVLSRWLALAPW